MGGSAEGTFTIPAEVQQGPGRVGDPAVHPGQEVELGDGARLVGLQVLQVEAPDQEVLAPDVLRHQVNLKVEERRSGGAALGSSSKHTLGSTGGVTPRRCGRRPSPRQASSGGTA